MKRVSRVKLFAILWKLAVDKIDFKSHARFNRFAIKVNHKFVKTILSERNRLLIKYFEYFTREKNINLD